MSSLHDLLNRQRPGPWQQFRAQPCIFLARQLYYTVYTWQQYIPSASVKNPVSVVFISDTHNSQVLIPDGDILIHGGDLTQSGSFEELREAITWLGAQPHHTKIVIAGNHDILLDSARGGSSDRAASERAKLDWGDIIYLENEQTIISCPNGRRLAVYGSPFSVRHGNWAFQYPQNEDALWRVRPRLHVFGHIHEGAGAESLSFDKLQSAYERTLAAGGGIGNLFWTAWEFMMAHFSPVVEPASLLVNPSIDGGLRDNERRQPIKVYI
ncbi:uncharacterized protein N7483_012463 [Penicillium malachiteum]|uniref:uncharacterized protein n=1 Tax=Penicillium malachiteum TaxID=1324776 RepID=UPI002548CFA7|nr:uncharacterized protein N7483_012463 [Penicillium malachiteum]KAJ5715282.1 hypothetical protein N7483_012463 [Penicillium malachiteum]